MADKLFPPFLLVTSSFISFHSFFCPYFSLFLWVIRRRGRPKPGRYWEGWYRRRSEALTIRREATSRHSFRDSVAAQCQTLIVSQLPSKRALILGGRLRGRQSSKAVAFKGGVNETYRRFVKDRYYLKRIVGLLRWCVRVEVHSMLCLRSENLIDRGST